tara:strand:+ start:528 stop:731 length:204 start_codon:yes stop_codon:yes gene_type:complete
MKNVRREEADNRFIDNLKKLEEYGQKDSQSSLSENDKLKVNSIRKEQYQILNKHNVENIKIKRSLKK